MTDIKFNFRRPGLLVSVRDVVEAQTALAAGADIIDVKEPNRGPLGAADASEIAAIVGVVQSKVPVTAALGELLEFTNDAKSRPSESQLPPGIALFKLGFAHCSNFENWQARWADVIAMLRRDRQVAPPQPVAVVYADWRGARAPDPLEVVRAGVEARCPALLVDTWDKSGGGLFDHWPAESLQDFVHRVQQEGMIIVLAGALAGDSIRQAGALGPDLIAVRGAACESGRNSAVSFDKVRSLKLLLSNSAFPAATWRREPTPTRS